MTDPKARKVCFDIIAQRREKLNNVADSMYPSVSCYRCNKNSNRLAK